MPSFSMGASVLHNGLPGVVLGVYPGDVYDVMYGDGGGGMQIPGSELSLNPSVGGGADGGGGGGGGGSHAKTKKSSIGWNPGALEEGGGEAAPGPAPAPPSKAGASSKSRSSSSSPGVAWSPSVDESVEYRDHATKEWKSALVVLLDADLGTVDVRFLDKSGANVEAKGVPLGLIRPGQGQQNSKLEKKKKDREGGGNAAAQQAPAASATTLAEIQNRLLKMRESELAFVLTVIDGMERLKISR